MSRIRRMCNELALLGRFTAIACLVVVNAWNCGCGPSTEAKPRLPLGVVDTPQANQNINGHFTASGWVVSEDGIKQVSLYIDRIFFIHCTYGLSRPDVNQAFPGFPQGDHSGWVVDLETTSLPAGRHELVFEAESNKGAIRDLGIIPVTVSR